MSPRDVGANGVGHKETRALVTVVAAILASGQETRDDGRDTIFELVEFAEKLVLFVAARWPDVWDDSDIPDPPNPAESVR